jgi:hypothetical protein
MESEKLLKPQTVERLLNSKTIKKNNPNLEYIKVFKSRKGYSIGIRFEPNTYNINHKDSELLKGYIADILRAASLDVNLFKIYYYRIFDREPVDL